MSDPDFSFIAPDIQLDQVPPLDHKRVIAFVNHFIMRSVHILNTFASNAEKKIFEIETRIGRILTELQLLESKLDSVPGIAAIGTGVSSDNQDKLSNIEKTIPETKLNLENVSPNVENLQTDSSVFEDSHVVTRPTETVTEEDLNGKEQLRYRDDPKYAKYFKMLRLGVVEAAVRQKMMNDGVDPDILSKPDEISEQQPTKSVVSKEDSNDDISNSEELSSD